ncbi:hypothetical protein RZS28_12890 [Methylocapsa polymorpha]|uniref:Uncharacterized protein n=1 Tax=Methylocapsa polymorpha TaxID=3080828 RepID=A0ABZ0HN26_9HYPH|nr:hypothetical protein RZS28_12890 [Methylocapsa sp. RX1]
MTAFSDLLQEEYGLPIAHWASIERWGDLEKLQISRALEVLIKTPIADSMPVSEGSDESGAKRRWSLSDQKIAGGEFEETWQWRLLAAIDNATKSDAGGMTTPSDPRLFVLRIRYERGFFAPLADYFLKFLCGRASFPAMEADPSRAWPIGGFLPDLSLDQAAALRRIPGLEGACPAFLAGTLFMIARIGTKSFCDWCADRC